MMKHFLKIFLLLLLILISEQTLALRCGTKLVDVGDNKPRVIALCGEPDYSEFREIRFPSYCRDRGYDDSYNYPRKYRYDYNFNFNYRQHRHGHVTCQYRTVEVWTYNFGPRKFMRELIFRRGTVKEINTLGYGY